MGGGGRTLSSASSGSADGAPPVPLYTRPEPEPEEPPTSSDEDLDSSDEEDGGGGGTGVAIEQSFVVQQDRLEDSIEDVPMSVRQAPMDDYPPRSASPTFGMSEHDDAARPFGGDGGAEHRWQDERRELMIKLRAKENQVLHAEQEIQAKHEEIQGCEPRVAANCLPIASVCCAALPALPQREHVRVAEHIGQKPSGAV